MARVIKEAVSDAITNHLNDPRIEGFISVTRVTLTADLRITDVFLSIFGSDEKKADRTFAAILHSSQRIQAMVAHRIKARYSPVVRFHLDDTLKKTMDVMKVIEEAAGGRKKKIENGFESKKRENNPDETSEQSI